MNIYRFRDGSRFVDIAATSHLEARRILDIKHIGEWRLIEVEYNPFDYDDKA